MRWITALLAAVSMSCAGTDGGTPRDEAGPGSSQPPFEQTTDQATIIIVAEADYDRLFDVVVELVRPFGLEDEDRPRGRVTSGQFGLIEQGIPRYHFIEVRLSPADELGTRFKVGVAVYVYSRRYGDGTPLGAEGDSFEWVYQGLDEPSQRDLADDILRTYLEGR